MVEFFGRRAPMSRVLGRLGLKTSDHQRPSTRHASRDLSRERRDGGLPRARAQALSTSSHARGPVIVSTRRSARAVAGEFADGSVGGTAMFAMSGQRCLFVQRVAPSSAAARCERVARFRARRRVRLRSHRDSHVRHPPSRGQPREAPSMPSPGPSRAWLERGRVQLFKFRVERLAHSSILTHSSKCAIVCSVVSVRK